MTNVLTYLENSSKKFSTKTAALDPEHSYSYAELLCKSKSVGSALALFQKPRKPIIVYMEKSVEALASFFGAVYAGCFYVFISPELPIARVNQILEVVKSNCIITLKKHKEEVEKLGFIKNVVFYEDAEDAEINEKTLLKIRENACDVDPLYCNFTSGSTGVPKGVLICHRSVIDFMNYFPDMFGVGELDIIGNQAPFDFDVSVKDIYSSIKVGATLVIIPKKLFSVLTHLIDYLCDNKVTTLIWAVSALCLISQLKGLTYRVPADINKILFSGEAMPIKQLGLWQEALPEALFVNLYGPTEITCNCTYYIVKKRFGLDEKLPIGIAFPNEKVFLLDEENNEVIKTNTQGELCVSGSSLALGYYNNAEQTGCAFVQNPLNSAYPETIYKTGDLAFYNEEGDFCFAGRKDFQIKHLGHRIELEELESTLNSFCEIDRSCCIYDFDKKKIIAFYVGNIGKKNLQQKLHDTLPAFMFPNVYLNVGELPLTPNGKINRKQLFENYKGGLKNRER